MLFRSSISVPSTDSAIWNITDAKVVDYWIRRGPETCRNRDGQYIKSSRSVKNINRKLNDSAFTKTLPSVRRSSGIGCCIHRRLVVFSASYADYSNPTVNPLWLKIDWTLGITSTDSLTMNNYLIIGKPWRSIPFE